MDYFTPQEVSASQWLYQHASRGAQVVAANSNYPWAFEHYNRYSYVFLDTPAQVSQEVLQTPVETVAGIMDSSPNPLHSYLVLTTSQSTEITLTGAWPAGSFSRITDALLASGRFHVVYQNADVRILKLAT
jgi:hypothetical protein